MAEGQRALHGGAGWRHTKVVGRVPQTDEQGKDYLRRFETTPGRMLIGECLPKSHTVPFDVVSRLLTKKEIGDVIDQVYRHTGQKETVLFADAIMALGFPRLPRRHFVRQGRHDYPRRQGKAGRRDPRPGEGLRAAISGRPDYAAGEV